MRSLSSLVFLLLLFTALPVEASASSVVINEVAWMGAKIENIEQKNWWRYEWLELYNNTSEAVSLTGWKIELLRTKTDWTLNLTGAISPYGYFLIVSSDKIHPDYDLNYSNLGGKFVNGGQKIILKNNNGEVIDVVDCTSGWFAGNNSTKQAMERKNPETTGDNSVNWQTSQNPGGTPKAENSSFVKEIFTSTGDNEASTETETTTSPLAKQEAEKQKTENYYSNIFFSEILPSPEGADEKEEWIEISNQNSFETDISNWKISDSIGTMTTYSFPEDTKIGANGFLIFSRLTTKITLNNDADGLSLLWPDGKVVASVDYEKAPRGQSYNKTDSGWKWSFFPTPGSQNKIQTASQEKSGGEVNEIPEELDATTTKKLAAVGEQIPNLSKIPAQKTSYSFPLALSLAIFSGFVILFLKTKIKNGKNI